MRITNLSAGYRARPVLRDISLTIAAGEILALVGPNGVGKSTLVRVVSGVLPAISGAVAIDGENVLRMTAPARARQVAVVPQTVRLPEAFRVCEIVLMGRTPHLPLWAGESPRDREIALDAMRRTEVAHLAERRVGELSGGEQQRVVIARALAQQPRVLLLDEPTAHLDLKHQYGILKLVRALAAGQGLAVLLTMHDLNQAARYSDRMALLSDGVVAAVGAPAAVLTAARLTAVYDVPISVITHPQSGAPLVVTGER
ncbi:MAG: heme ABC transporter ATP-binding protein [Anaerolineales bacterium]